MVGLGPGDAALLAPAAREALSQASVVVGYKAYIESIPPRLLAGKSVVSTGMTGEVERCAAGVERALAGESVAVVSSGDAGVYGMAGLVLELLEARGREVDFRVVPGISAVQAAAAVLGAPLTHDFACVSLSDLLTPWELIERRIEAAASADFVLALYNPASKRRTGQLPRALELIGRHRERSTPVGLVRQAFRPDQAVWIGQLGDFDPKLADMLSILVVGNASTRFVALGQGGYLLTPRGYAGKYRLDAKGSGDVGNPSPEPGQGA